MEEEGGWERRSVIHTHLSSENDWERGGMVGERRNGIHCPNRRTKDNHVVDTFSFTLSLK